MVANLSESRPTMLNVAVDGVVFENAYQIGIWRYFYEVMNRLNGRVRYDLWLRRNPVQACPVGISLRRDSARKPFPLPTVKLNPDVKDIFAFRYEDFTVENYEAHPHIKAKVAV